MDASPFAGTDRYRLLVDSISDYAIYMLDAGGIVSSWNQGAQRFKGYTESEILGQHFSVFYTAEDRATGRPATALRIAEQEGRFEREGWRLRKDGARFWAHVVIDPIRSPDGRLLGFAKITRDLTERRATQEALRRSEEQFRLLVQGVTDYAIYMLDPQGRVASWNQGAQRIKGYSALEIIGEHFERFYTDEDRAAGQPAASLETARREGRFEKEGWRMRKDGTRFRAHVVIDALRNDEGVLIGFAKVTRDVTERYKSQQELQRAQEALIQSQKMEAIGQVTGGVAHDFNNLLMAVLSSLELARRRAQDDPKLLGLIDNALKGAHRGAQLTSRMLAFARKQTLTLKPIDIAALVHGMYGLLQRSIGPAIAIETRFPAGLPPAIGDEAQLEAALLNLVVNARDAMPGGGTISIVAGEAQPPDAGDGSGPAAGRWIRLQVEDDGEGMDEATLKRAAEPFFTTKEVGKGTGLGLAMVKGLMEQSGGSLRMHSTRGQGTRVELLFPVHAAQAMSATPQDRPTAGQPPQRKLKVLVVDDDELVIANVAAMLEDMGHEVSLAGDGLQALAVLETGAQVDLVLTDQAMPRMTGLQLAGKAKARWPALPIILASGYLQSVQAADSVDYRLTKPYSQAQLDEAVSGAMASAEALPPGPAPCQAPARVLR